MVGDNITALGDSWLRMEFPGVSLGVYLGVYLRLVWTMLSVFCKRVIRVFFRGGYLFYYHFMHIMGLSYYVFQRGVFRVIEGSKRDFVSCHVFPVVVVDTMLKLNFLYSRFEVLYLLSNIGFFMCL